MRLWDAANWSEIATLRGFLQGCVSVAFSPDGQRIAAGGDGKKAVKLWDVNSLQEVLTLEASGSSFDRTAFSPDGNILGSATTPGTLRIWRAPSWEEIEAGKVKDESERAVWPRKSSKGTRSKCLLRPVRLFAGVPSWHEGGAWQVGRHRKAGPARIRWHCGVARLVACAGRKSVRPVTADRLNGWEGLS